MKRSIEPDLTIEVGGIEFREDSHLLCIRVWSKFVDAALASGMEESRTKAFRFPDLDPKDWEWIKSLMAPGSRKMITVDSVDTALSWFSKLESEQGLDMCDEVLAAKMDLAVKEDSERQMSAFGHGMDWISLDFGTTLDSLETSIQYNLPKTKKKCIAVVQTVTSRAPPTFSATELLERIIAFVKDDADCREALWSQFEINLPDHLRNKPKEELLENDLFGPFMVQSFKYAWTRSACTTCTTCTPEGCTDHFRWNMCAACRSTCATEGCTAPSAFGSNMCAACRTAQAP